MTLIAIYGGSGSGKTTLAEELASWLGAQRSVRLDSDSYYHDLSEQSLFDREKTNVDHPDSMDDVLLRGHLLRLINGHAIDKPKYDFETHTRVGFERIEPAPIIILDGLLFMHYPDIRSLADVKFYVSVQDDLRFIRRLQRDVKARGRTTDQVISKYLETVRPMHHVHVEPTRQWADLEVDNSGKTENALSSMIIYLKKHYPEWEFERS